MRELVLGEALEALIDHRGKTPKKLGSNFTNEGVPVASANLVQNGRLTLTEARFVDKCTFERWMPVHAKSGDVILTSEAPIGRVARVESNAPLVLGQRVYGLRGKPGVLDSDYLYYALQTKRVQSDLLGRSTGTTVSGIRQSALRKVAIPAPNFFNQQRIAQILRTLDEKIAANDTTSNTSRELARSTFARAAHQGIKVTIRDVAQLVARGITPKYVESAGATVLNQKCVRDQQVSLTPSRLTSESSVRSEKLLRQNDVLVNSTGAGTLGRVARWIQSLRVTVDSHITVVRFNSTRVDPVCAGFSLLRIESEIEGLAEGSTGQTELRRDLLAGLEIGIPNEAVQASIGAELTALDELALGLRQESDRLAATRDELLPLLMSGKVRVREAEKVVEGVV